MGDGLQVHHDLWHHSRLGRQHSWFPGASDMDAPEVNGRRDPGAFSSELPGHDAVSSSASTQHAPVMAGPQQQLVLCSMHGAGPMLCGSTHQLLVRTWLYVQEQRQMHVTVCVFCGQVWQPMEYESKPMWSWVDCMRFLFYK